MTFNAESKEEDENDKDNKTPFVGVEYLNVEQIPVLLDKVIKYLPLFNTLIDLHGLLSIQQIDFSISQYNAIRECFVKVKNSKLTRIDINEIIQKLDASNNDDIFDILSEDYITFAATLLECSYFLCDYLINFTSSQNKPKKVKHKNEFELISYIEKNIDLYIDQISYIEDIDPIDLYINVYNKLATLNEEELLKELSKNK